VESSFGTFTYGSNPSPIRAAAWTSGTLHQSEQHGG